MIDSVYCEICEERNVIHYGRPTKHFGGVCVMCGAALCVYCAHKFDGAVYCEPCMEERKNELREPD